MLLYSTKFSVNVGMNTNKFYDMVIDWNQNSPHDKIENLTGNENSIELNAGSNNCSLSINNFESENVIASHFIKTDEYGVRWTSDFIYDYGSQVIAIQLYRDTTKDTTYLPQFRPPHFVKQILDNQLGGIDGEVYISSSAICINQKSIELAYRIMNGTSGNNLPVVYITKTREESYVVLPDTLAKRLQGIAHVLYEESYEVSLKMKELTEGNNPYLGVIAIYYPNGKVKRLYKNGKRVQDIEKEIITSIYRYSNQQIIETKYIWSGLQQIRLQQKNHKLLEERDKATKEAKEAYDIFDPQLKEYEANLEDANRKIESLIAENQGLRGKLDELERHPLLYYGEEDELYEDEIYEIVIDALIEYIKNVPRDTRKKNVLDDIIDNNPSKGIRKKKLVELKNTLKGYRTLSPDIKKSLNRLGFLIKEDKKHYQLIYYGDSRYSMSMPRSGSDNRGGDNLYSVLSKRMF